jgi:hypothetical protein
MTATSVWHVLISDVLWLLPEQLYQALEMEPVDIGIMGYFNLIIDLKNEAVEKEGDEDYKVTDRCNMLQYIIGPISKGNYGYHSDASPLLLADGQSEEDEIYTGVDDCYLPTVSELGTFTLCDTNSTESTDTKLTHVNTERKNKLMNTPIELTGNSIHFQWPGSQVSAVHHASSWLKKDKEPSTFRLIISARNVCPSNHPKFKEKLAASVDSNIDPHDQSNWKNDYVHTCVIDKIR